jgi:hypothetical protein
MQFYPLTFMKPSAHIVGEQISQYPQVWDGSPIMFMFANVFVGDAGPSLLDALTHPRIASISAQMAQRAADVPGRHAALIDNFPPATSGSYERGQAHEFASLLTTQWLIGSNIDFVRSLEGPVLSDRFPGIMMHAHLMYWRFYLGRRVPNATSDLGDQAHARFYPYCSVLVLENDAANVLRQIQKHTSLLKYSRYGTVPKLFSR